MKPWLSYLLIIIFSLQALPVKELGKLFIKKAIIEKVQDEADESPETLKDSKETTSEKLFLPPFSFTFSAAFTEKKVKVVLHNRLPYEEHFHPDISTPPPDAA